MLLYFGPKFHLLLSGADLNNKFKIVRKNQDKIDAKSKSQQDLMNLQLQQDEANDSTMAAKREALKALLKPRHAADCEEMVILMRGILLDMQQQALQDSSNGSKNSRSRENSVHNQQSPQIDAMRSKSCSIGDIVSAADLTAGSTNLGTSFRTKRMMASFSERERRLGDISDINDTTHETGGGAACEGNTASSSQSPHFDIATSPILLTRASFLLFPGLTGSTKVYLEDNNPSSTHNQQPQNGMGANSVGGPLYPNSGAVSGRSGPTFNSNSNSNGGESMKMSSVKARALDARKPSTDGKQRSPVMRFAVPLEASSEEGGGGRISASEEKE
jgi:hypothetical protein